LVPFEGLELPACQIIQRANDNPQRDEEAEIEKILSSVTTSSRSQGKKNL
jgi:hypothetical protein